MRQSRAALRRPLRQPIVDRRRPSATIRGTTPKPAGNARAVRRFSAAPSMRLGIEIGRPTIEIDKCSWRDCGNHWRAERNRRDWNSSSTNASSDARRACKLQHGLRSTKSAKVGAAAMGRAEHHAAQEAAAARPPDRGPPRQAASRGAVAGWLGDALSSHDVNAAVSARLFLLGRIRAFA